MKNLVTCECDTIQDICNIPIAIKLTIRMPNLPKFTPVVIQIPMKAASIFPAIRDCILDNNKLAKLEVF